MKKTIFAILATVAMVACSNDEIVSLNQEAIQFGNAFVDNSVRGAYDPSYGATNKVDGVDTPINLTSFNVYGNVMGTTKPVEVFNGEAVSGTVGANSEWTCTKTQYWIESAKYNFAAVVNGDVTEEFAYDANIPASYANAYLPKTIEFTTTADANVDLLYARSIEYTGQPAGQNTQKVEFTFDHLLSKVKFSVENKSNTAAGYSFLVKNVKVEAVETASYDVANEKWGTGSIADFALANVELTNSTDATVESAAEKLVIPGTVKVSFTVDVIYGGETITSKNYGPYSVAVAAGKAYNLKAEVAVGEEIKFTVKQNPTWVDGGTTTYPTNPLPQN